MVQVGLVADHEMGKVGQLDIHGKEAVRIREAGFWLRVGVCVEGGSTFRKRLTG